MKNITSKILLTAVMVAGALIPSVYVMAAANSTWELGACADENSNQFVPTKSYTGGSYSLFGWNPGTECTIGMYRPGWGLHILNTGTNEYEFEIDPSNVNWDTFAGAEDALNSRAASWRVDLLEDAMTSLIAASTTPASQLQADYTQASTTAKDYIKNKPSLNFDPLGQATSSANVAQAHAVQRANHTGTQAASTITGLGAVATTSSYTDLTNKPTIDKSIEGTTQRTFSFPVFKNATVSSGTAVFHLTTDGTSGGAALFPNGIIADSIDVEVNDAVASYQMSYALSNGDKTVTVTANKLTTSNILTGILGQAQANGSVVRLIAWGY